MRQCLASGHFERENLRIVDLWPSFEAKYRPNGISSTGCGHGDMFYNSLRPF